MTQVRVTGSNHVAHQGLVNFSRQLRIDSTKAERLMWARLRNYGMVGAKFRRQQPIGPYVVDFVCFESKLIIEIDGGQHNEEARGLADREWTAWLESQGFQMLRFWNNEVLTNIDGALELLERSDK